MITDMKQKIFNERMRHEETDNSRSAAGSKDLGIDDADSVASVDIAER